MSRLKKTIVTLMLLFVSVQFYAQKQKDTEKIKSLKIAFLTERLNLNSKEAQAFWPIYNEYQDNRSALRDKEHKQVRSKIKESEKYSENEATVIIADFLKFEQQEENLRKDYLKKAAGVISAKKTLLLLRSEDEFRKQLIKKYHQKRAETNQNNR